MSEHADLAGPELPGGEVELEPWLAWLWADAVEAEDRLYYDDDARAAGHERRPTHPGLAFLASIQGTGLSIPALFGLVGASFDDGLLFGEHVLELDRPLAAGERYAARARVLGVERKHGRSGAFDVLRFEVRLRDPGGAQVARVENIFIVPRR